MSPKRRESKDPEALRRLLYRRAHTPAHHLVGDTPEDPLPKERSQEPPPHEPPRDTLVSTTLVISPEAWKRLAVYCFVKSRTLREALEEVLGHLERVSPDEVRAGEKARKIRRLNVLFPESLHELLRWTAVKMDTTMNAVVEVLVRKVLPDPDPELAATIRRLPRGPKPRRGE